MRWFKKTTSERLHQENAFDDTHFRNALFSYKLIMFIYQRLLKNRIVEKRPLFDIFADLRLAL